MPAEVRQEPPVSLNDGTAPCAQAAALYRQLIDHYRGGRLQQAWQLVGPYRALATLGFEAQHVIGTLALQTGHLAEAIHALGEAVAENPSSAAALNDYGIALSAAGNYPLALASYARAVELAPDFADAHFNWGSALFDEGQLDLALERFRAAARLDPKHVRAMGHEGLVHFCRQEYPRALECYRAALAVEPNDPYIHAYRGDALRDSHRPHEAIASYERALELDPNLPEVLNGRGSALAQQRRFDEALQSYEAALQIRDDFAEAELNKGNVLVELGRYAEARESLRRAVQLRAQFAEAHYKWADLERECGDLKAAAEHYDLALEQNPALPYLRGTRLHARMQLCDWRDFDRELGLLAADIESDIPSCPPFALLGVSASAALQRRAGELYVRRETPLISATPRPRTSGGKIRIGYFSADFCNHPVAHLTVSLFEAHDRNAFEVLAFSYGRNTGDAMRQRLESSFDRFIEVREMTDEAIAARAQAEGIDIAIDLGGFTRNARPGIFAARAAPVQIGYLGYMASTGAPYIDYMIVDRVLVPPEARRHISEKLIYLPIFQANDPKRPVCSRPISRADHKLPEDAFVYCCFNAPYKITPRMFAAWLRILARVPHGVLLLYGREPLAIQNLRAATARAGLAPERVVFAGALPLPEYLSRYRVADLFLDTSPYNAGTTAADALWMGLPLLTLAGEAPASRMGASLLAACGLNELVADSLACYENLAVELALSAERLAEMRQRLVNGRDQLPLFALGQLTGRLESALKTVHERCGRGHACEDVAADLTP